MSAPERIYGWLNTQLSVARFYGGCIYNGQRYVIAMEEDGNPLVRWDVLKREAKSKSEKQKEEKKKGREEKAAFEATLQDLFGYDI